MSLGEIPARTSMRFYYRAGSLNDSSGNGRTLTSSGSISDTAVFGRFGPCFDGTTSGTLGKLSLLANPFSAAQVANITTSLWLRFQTTSQNTNPRIIEWRTGNTTSAMGFIVTVNYSAPNFTISASTLLTTTDATASHIFTADIGNTWYNVIFVKDATTTLKFYFNGLLVSTGTGTGTDTSKVTLGTSQRLAFFNSPADSTLNQGWFRLDEMIVEERVWSEREIRKYYTQGRGRFGIY